MEPFAAVYFYTHDVARQLKLSSDGELAHALHETLHYALDAQQQDWGQQLPRAAPPALGSVRHAALVSPRLADSLPGSAAPSPRHPAAPLPDTPPTDPRSRLPPPRDGFFPNPHYAPSRSASTSTSTSPSRTPPPPPSPRRTPPFLSYGWQARTRTLSLPHPATIANPTKLDPCSPEHRSAFDVTAKLFFLDDILPPSAADHTADARTLERDLQARAELLAGYVENAIKRLSGSTGIITLDTLLLSFPPAAFDAPVSAAHGPRARELRLQVVADLWRALSQNPQLLSLGLSRFSLAALRGLFHLLPGMPHPPGGPPPTTPSLASSLVRSLSQVGTASSTTDNARWPDAYSVPRDVRRPRLVTAALPSSSSAPRPNGSAPLSAETHAPATAIAIPTRAGRDDSGTSASSSRAPSPRAEGEAEADDFKALLAWCEAEGIVPVADSDRKDVLPRRTLPALLKEFRDALPHPLPDGHRLAPRWVMKYSVVIRDRGVLADRGYILFAEAEPEPVHPQP